MSDPIEAQQRGLTRENTWKEFNDTYSPDFDMFWGEGLDAQDILSKFGIDEDLISSALAGVEQFTDSLSGILSVLEGAAEILSIVLGIALDNFEALISAIQEVLRSFINIFTGTSVSTLLHFPQTPRTRRTVDQVIYEAGAAYLDKLDDRRPVTISESFGYVLMGVWQFPNLASFLNVFENIKKTFGKLSESSDDIIGRYQKRAETFRSEDYLYNGTTGMKPDFNIKAELTDFFAISRFIKSLLSILNSLESRKSYAQALTDIINLARRKITSVTNQIQAALTAIQDLAQLFAFGEAKAVLQLSGSGTAEDFARAIINSPHHETFPSYDLKFDSTNPHTDKGLPNELSVIRGRQSAYAGVFLLHAQTTDPIGGVDRLVTLFNGLVKRTEESSNKIEDIEERITTNWSRIAPVSDGNYNASDFQE